MARALWHLDVGRLRNLEPSPPLEQDALERPGELIHEDVKFLARFRQVGHRITGAGDRQKEERSCGVGYGKANVAVDDATRLAALEVLGDEQTPPVIGFLSRVVAWFNGQGIGRRRVTSDNGPAYVSKVFLQACRAMGFRHLHPRPYTPSTNGQLDRFFCAAPIVIL